MEKNKHELSPEVAKQYQLKPGYQATRVKPFKSRKFIDLRTATLAQANQLIKDGFQGLEPVKEKASSASNTKSG